jgi:hypothetical protein
LLSQYGPASKYNREKEEEKEKTKGIWGVENAKTEPLELGFGYSDVNKDRGGGCMWWAGAYDIVAAAGCCVCLCK